MTSELKKALPVRGGGEVTVTPLFPRVKAALVGVVEKTDFTFFDLLLAALLIPLLVRTLPWYGYVTVGFVACTLARLSNDERIRKHKLKVTQKK